MYKYVIIVLLLLLPIGCASIQTKPITISVAFINGNPGVTTLGLAKFIVDKDGNKTDYKLMNMRWTDKVKVIYLEPGVYGVTQYIPKYDKVVSYQTFVVSNEPMVIKFRKLF